MVVIGLSHVGALSLTSSTETMTDTMLEILRGVVLVDEETLKA